MQRWVVPPLAVGVILVIDRRIWTDKVPLSAKAVADETAHVATTACLLSLLGGGRSRPFYVGAALGSVALDIDHVPMYAMGNPRTYRPSTHSLPIVVLVAGAAARAQGRRRAILQGLTFGLVSHLLRDVLTGGAPLLWPLSRRVVRIDHRGSPRSEASPDDPGYGIERGSRGAAS
jgi:LexA-binding, inner membrane-associated putative hydrolase